MKAKKVKGKDSKRWQKAIIGILLALIMMASVVSLLTLSTFGSDVTQITVRNGYIVNPDNVTISMDGNTTFVLFGQNVQFMCDGNKTGMVTVTGVEGTPAEGYVFISNSTGWLDTFKMFRAREGLYNATYGDYWELLAVQTPVMVLSLKVGTKEVSSICRGTPLGIDFTSNLDENDCVDLVVITPEGYRLTLNPADSSQKFDDINVSQLLEYGSGNETKRINTTGWKIGTYTFSVRTEEENARGLDVSSNTKTLAILKPEISIIAEKTSIVELEKVKLTVTGVYNHNITISSSDPAHTIFPADYEDNPSYDSSGFNDTIDADGVRRYVVYFNDSGSYTITVTDTTAGLDDTVDITVSEKAVTFDVPAMVVIGEKFTIKGTAYTGNTVDIAVEDYVYPELNDLIIDENGDFEKEIDTATTNITPFTVPGSVRLKAYIERAAGTGAIGPNETDDGSTAILMVSGDLPAGLITDLGTPVPGASNIWALTTGIDGKIYGGACDYADHAFVYDPTKNTSIDLGITGFEWYSLTTGKDGLIYAGGYYGEVGNAHFAVYDPNKSWNPGTSPENNPYDMGPAISPGDPPAIIFDLTTGIDGKIYGGTGYGWDIGKYDYAYLFQYDPKTKNITNLGMPIPDQLGISRLTTGLDGKIYGAASPSGHLFVYDPNTGNFTDSGAPRPESNIAGLTTGVTGSIYGGTGDGYLFFYDPFTNTTTVLGKVVPEVILRLTTGKDGKIYGGEGPHGYFFVYDPWRAWSPGDTPENNPYNMGQAVAGETRIRSLTAGMDGKIYGGTAWNAHLFVYSPSYPPYLNASISKSTVSLGDSFEVYGNASSDYVEIVAISPKGGNGTGIDGLYGVSIHTVPTFTANSSSNSGITMDEDAHEKTYPEVPGITSESIPVENNSFSKTINVSECATLAPTSGGGGGGVPRDSDGDFYKKIKVDSSADTGNYTILVLSPGIDGVYGSSSYKYIDSILDLDGTGPELGAIDVSNMTEEEIVSIIKNVTIDQAGSDDLLQELYLTVLIVPPGPPTIVTVSEPIEINATLASIPADGISTSNITIAVFWPKIEDYPGLGEIEGYENLSGTPAGNTRVDVSTTLGKLTEATNVSNTGEEITSYTNENGTVNVLLSGNEPGMANITARATAIEVMVNMILGNETTVYVVRNSTTVTFLAIPFFNTGPSSNPYPSISGTHNGTIKPNQPITVSELYTYPCAGTGGHTEYVWIYGHEVNVSASWNGYVGDWHNISFPYSFTLEAEKTYNYTIRTGSYPQIIHASSKPVAGGTITCTQFTDANGRVYYDWIPAIRLWAE